MKPKSPRCSFPRLYYVLHFVLSQDRTGQPTHKSIVWGPTCDSADLVREMDLPELEVGDWLYFDNTGAYSRSVATGYNGFELPICYYFIKDSDRLVNSSGLELIMKKDSPKKGHPLHKGHFPNAHCPVEPFSKDTFATSHF